tara:strand:- start:393 stop:530 length:138 start_codon:yes stop_codon:yes gene_type:complete
MIELIRVRHGDVHFSDFPFDALKCLQSDFPLVTIYVAIHDRIDGK